MINQLSTGSLLRSLANGLIAIDSAPNAQKSKFNELSDYTIFIFRTRGCTYICMYTHIGTYIHTYLYLYSVDISSIKVSYEHHSVDIQSSPVFELH